MRNVLVSGGFGGSNRENLVQLEGELWKTVSCPI
jgi:hypothetical protein